MELIIGAIVGVVAAVIFQPPLERVRNAIIKHARRLFYLAMKPAGSAMIEKFHLGSHEFNFLVIDGDGEHSYTPPTISCTVDQSPISLPPEVKELRDAIEAREAKKRLAAEPCHWNGPLYALKRYVVGRTVPNEDLELRLIFQKSDYYAFQATVESLDSVLSDGTTLRQRYLTPPMHQPIPFLSVGFGVSLVLLSTDHKIILSRRSTQSGVRPGELDVSFVEGIHPDLDRAHSTPCPDIYRTAIRGANEEVGVDLAEEDIVFLGFGVDLEYYQWNLIGMAHLKYTASEAFAQRSRGSGGKWETREFITIDAHPDAVWKFLSKDKLWAMGWVALYWTLVHEYGRKKVDASAMRHLR